MKIFANLLSRQLLSKLERPDGHDVPAGLADVCFELRVMRMVEDRVAVRADDRHGRRTGRHRPVAGKLRLAWHRRVTGRRCDLRSGITLIDICQQQHDDIKFDNGSSF